MKNNPKQIQDLIFVSNPLAHLQKRLKVYYMLYQKGEMSEEEYLINVKPIDKEISHFEMSLFYSPFSDDTVPMTGKQNQVCF